MPRDPDLVTLIQVKRAARKIAQAKLALEVLLNEAPEEQRAYLRSVAAKAENEEAAA